ncbi:hypothetical protein TUBRATIS_000380 [Tubulinosema ratisbonensis]|uniref:Uncharacterized protein n=1 Tax=Tubulinosema ratisbonensis TaxID=291195 RepID=A0A437AQG1_9MICR|nr:hypothetical protein TUBRATIS_000380 [Tubulinosema ratisbonensis]
MNLSSNESQPVEEASQEGFNYELKMYRIIDHLFVSTFLIFLFSNAILILNFVELLIAFLLIVFFLFVLVNFLLKKNKVTLQKCIDSLILVFDFLSVIFIFILCFIVCTSGISLKGLDEEYLLGKYLSKNNKRMCYFYVYNVLSGTIYMLFCFSVFFVQIYFLYRKRRF